MNVQAWCSSDGVTVQLWHHHGHRGLASWWRALPKIVGVLILFDDGTTHRMEASEFYAVLPHGRERARFWNGDCCGPEGAEVKAGIEVPDEVYARVDGLMDRGIS